MVDHVTYMYKFWLFSLTEILKIKTGTKKVKVFRLVSLLHSKSETYCMNTNKIVKLRGAYPKRKIT